jgi:hypothetical protein
LEPTLLARFMVGQAVVPVQGPADCSVHWDDVW